MKSIVAGMFATVTALGLLAGCGDDPKSFVAPNSTADATQSSDVDLSDITIPDVSLPDLSLPDGATIPAGGLPADVSIPEEAIDQMIAQFEAAGMKVDKECFKGLLSDESLRKMVEAGGTPNQDAIQKFFACLKT